MISAQEVEKLTDEEIVTRGLNAVSRELGLYGYARFLMLYRPGTGDYTRDRHQWLNGLTLDDIARDLASIPKTEDQAH